MTHDTPHVSEKAGQLASMLPSVLSSEGIKKSSTHAHLTQCGWH